MSDAKGGGDADAKGPTALSGRCCCCGSHIDNLASRYHRRVRGGDRCDPGAVAGIEAALRGLEEALEAQDTTWPGVREKLRTATDMLGALLPGAPVQLSFRLENKTPLAWVGHGVYHGTCCDEAPPDGHIYMEETRIPARWMSPSVFAPEFRPSVGGRRCLCCLRQGPRTKAVHLPGFQLWLNALPSDTSADSQTVWIPRGLPWGCITVSFFACRTDCGSPLEGKRGATVCVTESAAEQHARSRLPPATPATPAPGQLACEMPFPVPAERGDAPLSPLRRWRARSWRVGDSRIRPGANLLRHSRCAPKRRVRRRRALRYLRAT